MISDAEPHDVGKYGPCDRCMNEHEARSRIGRLETEFGRQRDRFRGARLLTKKIPIAQAMKRTITDLLHALPVGGGRLDDYTNKYNAVEEWLAKNATATEEL